MLTTAVSDWLNGDTTGLWPGLDWQEGALRPVAGLVDNPMSAEQFPLQFDLSRNHLAVLGDSGWGKTAMLRSLIISLTTTHSPDELHVYVVDLGGHNFRSIEGFPHVGTVVYSDEEAYEERLQRLLEKLDRLADERSQLLGEAAANNLWEYNARNPDKALPAVLVVIDNFADLHENYEALVEGSIMPLVRRSLSSGICFVVSANVPNNMPSKLYALFGERVTFKQANTDRLLDIVGRGAIEIDDIPGRGYIRVGKRPLLFQAALPVGIFGGEDGRDSLVEADEVRLIGQHMHDHIQEGKATWRYRPDPIDILPETVSLIDLLDAAGPVQPQRIQGVLGQLDTLQPARSDLKRLGPHFAIVGPPLSGKTTAMLDWILSLAERYSPDQAMMVLIDTQRKLTEYGGQHKLSDLPHVVAAVSEVEELEGLVANLTAEGAWLAAANAGPGQAEHTREIFVFVDNFDDFSEEIENQRALVDSMSRLMRRYQREGMHFIVAFAPEASTSDLRRRVLSANYGIGLQTAQAVDVLKVSRTPAGVRDKSLPVGRGYLVKSGQPVMIQVASPYEGMGSGYAAAGSSTDGDLELEAERAIQALDAWVERIKARYGDAKATWTEGTAAAEAVKTGVPSAKVNQMLGLVQRALRVETGQVGDGDGTETITSKLLATNIALWQDEATLMALMKDIWRKSLKSIGMDDMGVDMFISSSDETSVLWEVDRVLTTAEEELQARHEIVEAEPQPAAGEEPIAAAPQETEVES